MTTTTAADAASDPTPRTTLRFKLADRAAEFEAIHRLNHRCFVEEIPQHPPDPAGRLVDRFHDENTYAICLDGDELVGMIAGRCARPFSLDAKLPDLDRHLPPHRRPVEVRLLAVDARHRKQAVFARLAGLLASHFRAQGCDLAVISGTVRELRLYAHLGFRPFGPTVGTAQARYQPMFMTLADYATRVSHLERIGGRATLNLTTGPVTVDAAVSAAMARQPLAHRSDAFDGLLGRVRERLRRLCRVHDVLLMPGSGTLANDAIAAQLAAEDRPGLILSNGEFGERLIDHARRWRLRFERLHAPWGDGFDEGTLRAAFQRGRPRWVWLTACETSTGVRNPLDAVDRLCREHGTDLCVDAVSAVGLQSIDLSAARFASTVSGKALAAFPGLAIVCHDGRLVPAGRVPRALDLAASQAAGGVPHTQPSNLVDALEVALDVDWPRRWERIRRIDGRLRHALRQRGLRIVAADDIAMPGVITIARPDVARDVPDTASIARRLARSGFVVAHRSDYLVRRGWIQLCLMSPIDEAGEAALEILPDLLAAPWRAQTSPEPSAAAHSRSISTAHSPVCASSSFSSIA